MNSGMSGFLLEYQHVLDDVCQCVRSEAHGNLSGILQCAILHFSTIFVLQMRHA